MISSTIKDPREGDKIGYLLFITNLITIVNMYKFFERVQKMSAFLSIKLVKKTSYNKNGRTAGITE